jgi:hypothetical protein
MQYIAPKLAANGFSPLAPAIYQPQGYKYIARKSGFELSKFGMADYFFTFAEIPDLTPAMMSQFSAASFNLANANKAVGLPNGFFSFMACFAVAITENLNQETANFIANTTPPAHWASNEIPVAFDLTSKNLVYFQNTPVWGAAYFAGFRRRIEANLR